MLMVQSKMLLKRKILFPSATFSFPTVIDHWHYSYHIHGKKLRLPMLFTLPQNSFNILIDVIKEHLLYMS